MPSLHDPSEAAVSILRYFELLSVTESLVPAGATLPHGGPQQAQAKRGGHIPKSGNRGQCQKWVLLVSIRPGDRKELLP